jgi:DDE superfamily endonuclease
VAARGLAADQKKARRRGASIVFIDETGFRLQSVNRRTWAPRGQTPVQRAWDRYDRLSVIGAVALSPTRRQISTPFQIHDQNICTDEVVAFVKQLRRHFRRPLVICWDRWSVHRSAAKKLAASRLKSIDIEWLPAYAPELNPVKPRWSHTKFGKLANFVPDDTCHLKRSVRVTLKDQSHHHCLKQSFFKTAQLDLGQVHSLRRRH